MPCRFGTFGFPKEYHRHRRWDGGWRAIRYMWEVLNRFFNLFKTSTDSMAKDEEGHAKRAIIAAIIGALIGLLLIMLLPPYPT